MFELILVFGLVMLSFFVSGLWFWLIFGMGIVLILPGVYAMFFGAPYINTAKKRRNLMIDLADLGKGDRVVDLGCGNGDLIREVACRGVKNAVGYELSVLTWLWASLKGVFRGNRTEIRFGNFWKADLNGVNVIFCFLLKDSMLEFERKIWPKLNRGVKVVSNVFKMDGVEPVMSNDGIYLYIKK